MKKIIASLLCLIMVFSMVACGTSDNKSEANAPTGGAKTEASKTEAPKTEAPKTEADKTEAPKTDAPETEAPKTEEPADNGDLSDATLGGKLALEFLSQIKDTTDLNSIAEKLSAEDFCGYNCASMEVAEGFLNGFSEEIKGFKNGVVFMPMIGSIPFVNYIFETDDAETLKATLLDKADPRWNICTEAKETVCVTSGNYVFFTMCPPEE